MDKKAEILEHLQRRFGARCKDLLITENDIYLSWWDRIRLLFSGRVTVRHEQPSVNDIELIDRPFLKVKIWPIFPKLTKQSLFKK